MVAAIHGPFPRAKLSNATHRRRIAPVDEKLQMGTAAVTALIQM